MGCTLYKEEHLVPFYINISVHDFEESFFSSSEKAIAAVLTFTGYFCCHIKTVILNSPNSFQPRLCVLGGFHKKTIVPDIA
jgi:hypothetical protein